MNQFNAARPFQHRRLAVVGAISSGKSTLARRLSRQLGLNFVELDALHWDPQWTPAPLEVFRERVQNATAATAWAVAGNYHAVRDLVWPRAELVISLDYTLPVVFWRLLVRTVRRAVTAEELWNGNRENFWSHLKLWSDDSVFRWLFITYWRRKREYPALLSLPEHRHLELVRLRSPGETEAWFLETAQGASKMKSARVVDDL